MEKAALEKRLEKLEILLKEKTPEEMERQVDDAFDIAHNGPPRAPGNEMIPNNKDYPHIVNALNADGLDLVFRTIWIAKVCRLESVIARTSAILVAIKVYGGGAVVLQETLEKYTGATPTEQVNAIKAMFDEGLHPDVKLGIETMLCLMHDYCHLKSDRDDEHAYVGENLDLDAKIRILARRCTQYVYSDHLPFYH